MAEVAILQQWCQQLTPVLELESLSQAILQSFVNLAGMDHGFLLVTDPEFPDYFKLEASSGIRMPPVAVRIRPDALAPLLHWNEPIVISQLPPESPEREALRRLENELRGGGDGWERAGVALCFPLMKFEQIVALICIGRVDTTDLIVHPTSVTSLAALSTQALAFIENAQTFEKVCISYRQMVENFADAIDSRNPHARGHSRAVAYYAGLTARQMILPEREVEAIELAGFLHDIGRISIPDDLLCKPPPLTEEEMNSIRAYPVAGATMVEHVEALKNVAPLVRYHCESYDGTGTPEGLTGDGIPVGARILTVAHRFCAMIQPRAYRRPLSVVHGAIYRLQEESGRTLDPNILEAFLKALGYA